MNRRIVIAVLLCALLFGVSGDNFPPLCASDISIGRTGLAFTFLPQTTQLPAHLASPTEFNSRVAIPTYQDTTIFRDPGYHTDGAAHLEEGFLFNIAGKIPLLRLHAAGDEERGIGLQADYMIPFVTDEDWIAMAMEFVINIGVTASLHPSFAVSVSRKHICSHLLDRSLFTDWNGYGFLGTSSSDVDSLQAVMAIRDSFVFSLHLAPEELLFPDQDLVETSLYVDYGYSLPGGDPFGEARYTRPSYRTSRYIQWGGQVSLHLCTGRGNFGSLAAGYHVSYYENSGYTPNTGFSLGYILPTTVAGRNVMVEYASYDGRAVMEEYYGHRERYTSIGLKIMH
jgi:hypothetical protein